MRSKTSFFKISSAIIKEDFRRFWAIPVLSFVIYFLFAVMPVISEYGAYAKGQEYLIHVLGHHINTLLMGQNPFIIANVLGVPVLSGLLLFSYLHRTGSVMSIHSQPVTRNQLFHSHVISAVIFQLLPLLITGVILLIIAKPIIAADLWGNVGVVDLFSRTRILKWMWDSFLTGLFVLAVTVFSGMITGTSVHHFIAAMGFNAILPILYLMLTGYFSVYLFGFTMKELRVEYLSPVLLSIKSGWIGLKWSIIYLIAIIIIFAVSLLLYNKRRLERATDGIVFQSANVLITLLFGFLGMTFFGFLFDFLFSSRMRAVGYVVGAFLTMFVIQIIIMKTFRVMNKQFVKILTGYLLVAAVFFLVLNCGLTGYEKRLPDTSDVGCVRLSTNGMMEELTSDDDLSWTDGEIISDVEKLQEFIIENKDYCENPPGNSAMIIDFDYYDGKKAEPPANPVMSRSYNVPEDLILSSDVFKQLAEDIIADSNTKREKIDKSTVLYGELSIGGEWAKDSVNEDVRLSAEDVIPLLEIYQNELMSYSTEERIERMKSSVYAYLNIGLTTLDSKTHEIVIKAMDSACVSYLKEKGIFSATDDGRFRWNGAVIQAITDENISYLYSPDYVYDERYGTEIINEDVSVFSPGNHEIPQADEQTVVVTDPEQIQELCRGFRSDASYLGSLPQAAGSGQIYCLTFYRAEGDKVSDYMMGLIEADDIPSGIAHPQA